MPRLALFVLLACAAMPSTLLAKSLSTAHAADVEAVRAAVLDYVEGLYEVAPNRIERSVHEKLAKVGWKRDAQGTYREFPRTYEQLLEGARRYNRDGQIPVDALKEITIYEVLDKTASVKLTAEWGIDYMHLVKLDGKWMIRNVLWQGHPSE
ncbi:MAG: nuclear transport factor 2 family protein [Acidobacteriota bacterium]